MNGNPDAHGRQPLNRRQAEFYEYINHRLLADKDVPTARHLAARFGTTVKNAYKITCELSQKGWIEGPAPPGPRKEKLAGRKRCELVDAYVRDAPEGTRLRIVVQGDRPEGDYIGNKRVDDPVTDTVMGPPRYRVDAILDPVSARQLWNEVGRYLETVEDAPETTRNGRNGKETTVGKEA